MRRSALIAALLMLAPPAMADERADIEAACVKLGLGPNACTCIAGDTMERFEPRMREVVYLSLSDEVGFKIMAQAGQVTAEELEALNDYQIEIEPFCKVGQ
jgi:hypothetical protein